MEKPEIADGCRMRSLVNAQTKLTSRSALSPVESARMNINVKIMQHRIFTSRGTCPPRRLLEKGNARTSRAKWEARNGEGYARSTRRSRQLIVKPVFRAKPALVMKPVMNQKVLE